MCITFLSTGCILAKIKNVKNDLYRFVTPPGFKVIEVPRSDGRRGGGLAVIYRDHLSVIFASTPFLPTSFEMQNIRLAVFGEQFVIMVIYRLHQPTWRRSLTSSRISSMQQHPLAATIFLLVISTVPEILLKPSTLAFRHCYRATTLWP